MKKYFLFLFLVPLSVLAQNKKEIDVGACLSVEAEKELYRNIDLGLEEEIRFVNNPQQYFERTSTAIGIDYALFNKKVKIGAYYAFIYLYNNDHFFEPRYRYYFNLSYKETVASFIVSWRGRLQSTYRDESRGEYKINPKYAMKNKLEIAYTIWGSPWRPYLSCDFSTDLRKLERDIELTRIRYHAGVSWRLNRTEYMDFFLRFDNSMAGNKPNVLSIGITYKIKIMR